MEDHIYSILVEKEEITWRDMIYDLVKSEQMDPWDIEVSKLTNRYLQRIRDLKEHDFQMSGKVLLAAALLVKMKSKLLVGADLDEFDRLLAQKDIDEDALYDDLDAHMRRPDQITDIEKMKLIPRTPQPRRRKLSIYDLVGALEKALEVKKRRLMRVLPHLKEELLPNRRHKDIGLLMRRMYKKILDFFNAGKKKVLFTNLFTGKPSKLEKVHAIQPLLQLSNDQKLDLYQEVPFGDIDIRVIDKERLKAK